MSWYVLFVLAKRTQTQRQTWNGSYLGLWLLCQCHLMSWYVLLVWMLWSAWFRTCLLLVSQYTKCFGPHDFPACLPALFHYTLESLPAWFQAWLVSHLSPLVSQYSGCSECFGPYDFALVSHLCCSCLPLHLGFSARMISGLSHTCLQYLSSISSGCSQCRGPPALDSLPIRFHMSLPLVSTCLLVFQSKYLKVEAGVI